MSEKFSGKFHPIPSTIANQRWISIRNIIIYLETKSEDFCIWRPFCTLVTMSTAVILKFFNPPPKSCHILRCIFYSYKVDHNMAPKPWISIPNIKIYLETKFFPNRRIFLFWWPFWIQNGHHSKPSMNINLQHHNLLGNQISPKAEEFCILDTMATATILNFFNTPKSCHTLRWIFLQSFMKGIQIFF
jgi:hypothetical protein